MKTENEKKIEALIDELSVLAENLRSQNRLLLNEVEKLILHAESDTLHYSELEHARKLVFDLKGKN